MTKGYKATYNYKCLTQTYEIGKEYKLDEKPIICARGFHYCLNAKNTLNYYNHNHKFKLLEIEDLSNDTVTEEEEDDKSCSNHIKIVREISDKDELYELLGQEYAYDSSGNILTYKNSDGFWRECTYNKNGKELTFKNSHGYWREFTWDEFGKILTFKDSNGFWREYAYDSSGKILTYKNSSGYWYESTYNEFGKELTYKDSYGHWRESTYDSNGNKLTYESGKNK